MAGIGDLRALLPLILVALSALLVMAGITMRRHHGFSLTVTLLGLFAAGLTTILAAGGAGVAVGEGGGGGSESALPGGIAPLGGSAATGAVSLLVLDGYALFFLALVLLAALGVTLLSAGYLRAGDQPPEEYYFLLLLATLGAGVIVAANHFASVFLGLEILSVSLYGLIAYPRRRAIAVEAGIKYLVLAGFSSAFLIFGMALLYAQTGTLALSPLAERMLAGGPAALDPIALAGLALLAVGFGFKLAVVPFHMWTPDVYQGAPAPVTAFVATASKGAVLALLLRFALCGGLVPHGAFATLFALIAVASMFLGNLLALRQESLKRMLAYSSIAHLGYALVAFLAAGERGALAVAFYLSAYTVTTLGAFGVISVLSTRAAEREEPPESDLDALADYRGLGRRRPWLAATLAATLLSLAGIPLTAGFVGKFLVVAAGVRSGLWALVLLLAVNSAISVYYYLRVIVAMYLREEEEKGVAMGGRDAAGGSPRRQPWPAIAGLTLAGLMLALFWLGAWPGPLLRVIESTLGGPS